MVVNILYTNTRKDPHKRNYMIKAIALYYIMGVVTSLYFIYYYRLSERTKGGFIQMNIGQVHLDMMAIPLHDR